MYPFQPASALALASKSRFTDLRAPVRVMNRFRFTGIFPATTRSALLTCSLMPRNVRRARLARYW